MVFHPNTDPFLDEHRLRQKPFLPAVAGLEMILQAASLVGHGNEIQEIIDVEIVNGLLFHTSDSVTAKVRLHLKEGSHRCELVSELRNREGRIVDPARLHVRGTVLNSRSSMELEAEPPTEPPLGWHPFQYAEEGLLYHGPAFRQLREFAFQYDGGWGRITAPTTEELAGDRASDGWILPLAVLDACLVCCGSFVFLQFGGQIEVPQGFRRLAWTRSLVPGETCIVQFHFRRHEDRHSFFDFTLYGQDGKPRASGE